MLTKYKLVEISHMSQREYNGIVHDLCVQDDHSYTVGGGIAVHNSACATRKNAGVGVPQLYAIRTIREKTEKSCHIPLISDGGISDTGDIPKALKYADAVMVARLVAGTAETPGLVYENERGELYKVFGGSASGENKVASGQDNNFVEGSLKLVPFIGHVKYVLKKSKEMIQTSFSYVGAKDLREFRKRAHLYKHTSGGRIESKL